ncbi:MAG: bifunctional adenosylcobinamide kinase/adenosylcobinamide-phosphate guanylyltransferase [Paracoccaceae bacterium]
MSEKITTHKSRDITLVLGGASSGKSAWAEQYILGRAEKVSYIATAQAFDAEMKEKIARHRARRGDEWTTLEEPLDIVSCFDTFRADHPVLLDCATLWLSNLMLAQKDLVTESTALIEYLKQYSGDVVIVSNETGLSVVPHTKMGRDFQKAQGHLNQQLAALADRVVFIVAGLPMLLKGQLERDNA